jgi:hypothetical protein
MSGNNRQKMTILSDETHKIASEMKNFSGWLRAQLRLKAEGTDAVEQDLLLAYNRLEFKALVKAIKIITPDQFQDIWDQSREILNQRTLGDFE